MPLTHIDEKLCYQILHEYKIHNAEVCGHVFAWACACACACLCSGLNYSVYFRYYSVKMLLWMILSTSLKEIESTLSVFTYITRLMLSVLMMWISLLGNQIR